MDRGCKLTREFGLQHSITLTASPPREVSLYLSCMSRPVSRRFLLTLSSETRCLKRRGRCRHEKQVAVEEFADQQAAGSDDAIAQADKFSHAGTDDGFRSHFRPSLAHGFQPK